MSKINLLSSDDEIFVVDLEIAKCLGIVKTMSVNCRLNDGETDILPLPNVNSAILSKVLQYVQHHKDDPPPPKDDGKVKSSDDISQWDSDFLKIDKCEIFALIAAANYLDIPGLLTVGCKTAANMMKEKTPEEIRATFGIKSDFTTKEEEKLRKDNEWCEEK